MNAQTFNAKTNNKKCRVGSFNYNEKFAWKEIDCSKVQGKKVAITKEKLIKKEQDRLKMIAYQQKLKDLGYDVEINGILKEKTIKAHNKYLKKKNKAERQKQKTENRKAKSE